MPAVKKTQARPISGWLGLGSPPVSSIQTGWQNKRTLFEERLQTVRFVNNPFKKYMKRVDLGKLYPGLMLGKNCKSDFVDSRDLIPGLFT